MAEIEITCPECGNKRSVPGDLAGKKIKCRKCQSIFNVKAPPPKGAAPAKGAAPTKGGAKVATAIPVKDEEEDGKNPYIMREENLAARCPFCAQLMDPPDAKICLHCGYDMQKRGRVESKITYEITFVDYLLHHLPTFLCFVAIGAIVGISIFLVVSLIPEWIGTDAILPDTCFQTWVVIFALFPIWHAGKFIFKRLVWNFHPPEKEKKIKDE